MKANTRFEKSALVVATVLASLGMSNAIAGSNDCGEIASYLCNEPFYALQAGTARGAEGPLRSDTVTATGQADGASGCADVPAYMCSQPFYNSTPAPDAHGAQGPVRSSEAGVTGPLASSDASAVCGEIPVYMCREPFYSPIR
jgi:hypothetical protein